MTTIKKLIDARPMGEALLVFLLAHAVLSVLVLYFSPVQVSGDFYASISPDQDIAIDGVWNSSSILEKHGILGCSVGENEPDEVTISENRTLRFRCIEAHLDPSIYGQSPLRSIRRILEDSSALRLDSYTFSYTNQTSNFSLTAGYAVLALIAAILLRQVDFRSDLGLAARAVRLKPWVLVLCPAASIVTFASISAFFPPIENRLQPALEIFQALAPSLLVILVVSPLFEEALFRHWAYVRTIDNLRPAFVALGTSWFFMLAHVLNPQVSAVPAFLPTIFVAGLVLFWIRHQFNSISLTFFSHAIHNGLILLVADRIGSQAVG